MIGKIFLNLSFIVLSCLSTIAQVEDSIQIITKNTDYGLKYGAVRGLDTLLTPKYHKEEVKIVNGHLILRCSSMGPDYGQQGLWDEEGKPIFEKARIRIEVEDELFFVKEKSDSNKFNQYFHYTKLYNSITKEIKDVPNEMRGMTIWNFKEGIFARVFNEGYVGLVDKELNYVVEPNKYKQIIDGGGSFLGGLLHVTYSGKHGCFNHKGELTIPFDYDSLVTRSNKIAFLKKEGKWSWYDNERSRFCESLFDTRPKGVGDDYVLAVKEGQQYLYRRDSCQKKAFSRPVQNCIQINSQSSNYYYPSINGFKGCILGNGELIIPIKYESVRYAQFANVFIVKDNYFSVLDTTGEFISKDVASSPFQLGGDRAFNNVLIIDKDGKKGLLDSYGRIVLAPVFDKVQSRPFKDSLYIVFHEGKGKIYNAETKNFLPNSYDELIWFRECLIVKNKGMYNFLDYDLKKVSHNSYTEIKREREFYIVKSKDKLGAVYRNGSEVVPCQYEEVIVQRHSVYLSAYSNNRSERDIYNSLGMKLIGNAQSTPDLHCNDSLLIFKVDGKEGLMKINGEVIVEPLYDYIFVNCEHALSAVKLGDKFGYINNRSGELVIPLRFGDARKFKGKMALVSDEKYGKLYWIDEKGNRVK